AAAITETARRCAPEYLSPIGGTYSSEWFWSKIWHCRKVAPDVFDAAASWVELADFVPAVLAGVTHPGDIVRGVCAAGHKALYSEAWGGLPSREFLCQLDPGLRCCRRTWRSRSSDSLRRCSRSSRTTSRGVIRPPCTTSRATRSNRLSRASPALGAWTSRARTYAKSRWSQTRRGWRRWASRTPTWPTRSGGPSPCKRSVAWRRTTAST